MLAKNSLKDKLELWKKKFHLLVQQDMLTLEGHHDDEEQKKEKWKGHSQLPWIFLEDVDIVYKCQLFKYHLMIDVGFI